MAEIDDSTVRPSILLRLVDACLHPKLRQAPAEDLRQARLIVFFFSIGSLVLGAAFVARHLTGDHVLLAERGLASAPLVLIPLTLRVGIPLRVVRDFALMAIVPGLTFIVWASGGATSKALYLYAMLPFFAGVIEGGWKSVLWMVLALAAAGTFYVLDAMGIALDVRIPTHAFQIDLFLLGGAMLTVLASGIAFTHLFRKNRQALSATAKRLQELNAELTSLNADTARLGEAKHAFVAHILHEVSAPVRDLADAAQSLPRRVGDNEELARCAGIIARSGDQLATVADGMARLGDQPTSTRAAGTLDLTAEVDGLTAFFVPLANARDAGLTYVVAPSLQVIRQGSAHHLRQIIVALVLPALDQARDGGVHLDIGGNALEVTVEVTTMVPNASARRAQRDGGLNVAVASQQLRTLGGSLTHETLRTGGTRDRATLPFPAALPVAS